MSTATITHEVEHQPWVLPDKGTVGMACLIAAESAIFIIFVVAYIFYIGQSLSGPTPREVLKLPIFNTICLLSSSLTIHWAVGALEKDKRSGFAGWLAATVVLGSIFLIGTGMEWYHLIVYDHLTIRTNLFGTTFYSLVGLHATHVVVGLLMLALALILALMGKVEQKHAHRMHVVGLYWHFVDAVWVVVFTVVYVIGR